jgi:hypothetical protein
MKKNKDLFYIIFLVILIVVTVILFIIPNTKKLSLITDEVMKNQSRLEQLQKSGHNKMEALNNYYSVKEGLPNLKDITPKRGEELAFITNLENFAEQNNLNQEINIYLENNEDNQQGLSLAGPGDKIEKKSLPFQLILDGSYYNILSFLRDLELSEYYLNIEKIQITQSNLTFKSFFTEEMINSQNNIRASINGISYWQ